MKLEIDGRILIKEGFKPSKNFGIVLNKLLVLKLDGIINTFDEELTMAKKIFYEIESKSKIV
jgi:hypothetical protein